MPKFSAESFSKLSTCHRDLQILFFEVVKYLDCTIIQGYRNEEDQELAFKNGNTKLHYPKGKHNAQPSMAVDVMPFPLDWHDRERSIFFGGFVLGIAQKLKEDGKMEHSVRWGGSWNGLGKLDSKRELNDDDHFELVG